MCSVACLTLLLHMYANQWFLLQVCSAMQHGPDAFASNGSLTLIAQLLLRNLNKLHATARIIAMLSIATFRKPD
jgi:hypothetical protein